MRFPFPAAASDAVPSQAEEELGAVDGQDLTVTSSTSSSVVVVAPEVEADSTSEPASHDEQASATLTPDSTLEVEAPPMNDGVEAAPEAETWNVAPPVTRPPSRRKVIAFPRQASLAPEPQHRLADPVVPEQPRILDVPEELEAFPCAPLLDGLQLPSHAQATAPADHVELPFQPVSTSQRVFAGMIDCALVAAAAAMFGAVCYKMLPRTTLTKPILLIAAAIPVLFWATYQYLLTMYGGATIGMRTLHMRLSTFKGGVPSWRYRRSRVIGLYFSAASLAMGLLWALVDVDGLCWHDRISRTYLTKLD